MSRTGHLHSKHDTGQPLWQLCVDYVFLLRPEQFHAFCTTLLLGVISAYPLPVFSFELVVPLFSLLMVVLIFGGILIFNQLSDRETDEENQKPFVLRLGTIPPQYAVIFGVFLTLAPLVWAFVVSTGLFWMLICLVIAGGLYNFLGLMKQPVLGAMMILGFGMLCFSLGYYIVIVSVETTPMSLTTPHHLTFGGAVLFSLPFGPAWLSMFLLGSIEDIQGDRKVRKNTFAVRFGRRATEVAAFIASSVALILATALQEWVLAAAMAIAAPVIWILIWRRIQNRVTLPIKLSLVVLTLGVSMYYPIYLLFAITIYAATGWYRNMRFSASTPKENN